MILSDCFPSKWPPCPADEIARHATEFEKFKRGAVRHRVSNLTPPASVTKGSEIGTITWSRRGSVGVGLFVVVVGEVIEGLDGVASVGVKRYAIISRAVDVFEGVEG